MDELLDCPRCGHIVRLAYGACSGSIQAFALVGAHECRPPFLTPDASGRMLASRAATGGWTPHWRACSG